MTAVLVITGSLLVAVALVDEAWTTVAAGSGGGPLTTRIARRLWHAALWLHRRTGRHAVLEASGVLIVFVLLAVWIALALLGWTAVFSSSTGAVVDTNTSAPGDLVDRVYFAGYTVFTLGIGDFRPGEGLWQLATVVATGTGLLLVTLSITYLVPVASAAADRRQLAGTIASLGGSPGEILLRGWTGSSFDRLIAHLVPLTAVLEHARQQHFTYPVLHYFHSSEPTNSAAVNVVNLADALLLLSEGVAPQARPHDSDLRPLRESVAAFLRTTGSPYAENVQEPHPAPSLEPLREAGIPTVDDAAYLVAVAAQEDRRRLLRGLLEDDGWVAP